MQISILLDVLENALNHRIFNVITGVGIAFVLVLMTSFILMARSRNNAVSHYIKHGSKIYNNLPQLSIIMPCKGIHENSISNWHAQTGTVYPGPVEFIFVTESKTDPAYTAAMEFKNSFHKPNRSIRVEVAGLSWHNSQKIHNWLEGLAVADSNSKYVMCLDDDIKMYRDSLATMVGTLEEDEKCFAATGYSFEIPQPGTGIVNYMIMAYRLVLMGAFFTDRPAFLWGGCMILRHEDVKSNSYGIIDAWRDGGYSEDFLAVSILKQVKRQIAFPHVAIFPNVLKGERSFSQYWNFICRQFFVLGTYCSTFNKVHNFTLVILQFLLPVFIWSPLPLSIGRLFFFVRYSLNHSAEVLLEDPRYETSIVGVTLYLIAVFFLLFNLKRMILALARVCITFTDSEPISTNITWWKVYVGFVGHCFLLPISVVWAYIQTHIVWAGTDYHITNGKVSKMERVDRDGNSYSESTMESLEEAVRKDAARGFLNSTSTWAQRK